MATALITRGSAGIGLELARLFAEDGYDLIIIGKDKRELRKAKDELEGFGVRVHAAAIDLAHPGAPRRVFNAVRDIGPIDILVNDASAIPGAQSGDIDEQTYMIDTNVRAFTALTYLFIPQLIQRKGRLLTLAPAALTPGPGSAMNRAAHVYVLSLSDSLADQLQGKVTVTTLAQAPERHVTALRGSGRAADAAIRGYDGLMRGERIVAADRGTWAARENDRSKPFPRFLDRPRGDRRIL